jgi:hypothetical protein
MGDFGQLPPVGDKPMYVSGNGTVVSDHGHSLYLMFESVIITRWGTLCPGRV